LGFFDRAQICAERGQLRYVRGQIAPVRLDFARVRLDFSRDRRARQVGWTLQPDLDGREQKIAGENDRGVKRDASGIEKDKRRA
jgi:hypothetical protein